MPRDDATADDSQAVPPGDGPPRQWPLYVRVLAIAYVLSYAVQWVGFLLLTGTAAVLYGLRHRLDSLVIGLGLGGVACVVLSAAFRRWFIRWGRKHWPPAGEAEKGQDA